MADSPLQRAVDDGRAKFCLPPSELGGSTTHSHWLILEACELLNIQVFDKRPETARTHLHGGLNDKSESIFEDLSLSRSALLICFDLVQTRCRRSRLFRILLSAKSRSSILLLQLLQLSCSVCFLLLKLLSGSKDR